jgi:N-acetyl-gamma-glutamyl-phosphate reductase
MKIRAGISGAAGYTGGELLRLLLHHPAVDLVFAQSNSHAGRPIHDIHTDLLGDSDLCFSNQAEQDIDVLFLCNGHGAARAFLENQPPAYSTKVIDLSQDFRLREASSIGARTFVYGLPEVNRQPIRLSDSVANPGCFATAIQLALLPLAKAGLLEEVHVTGITGSTGAGQALSPSTHFSWRTHNVSAYKTLTHQHLAEIEETLQAIAPQGRPAPDVHFVPWRGPFARGIFVSAVARCRMDLTSIKALYQRFYADAPFTHLSEGSLDLKQVVQTNKCIIQLEQTENMLVVHAAIDNLLKGASGQALQNMNLMFGLDETLGLRLKPSGF